MLKKLCFGFLSLVSLFMVSASLYEESITMVNFYNEKIDLESQDIEIQKIEIPEWNFERFVKVGAVNQIDNSFATYIPGNKHNIVIAGHDIPIVFHELQKIKIGMKIYLKKGNKMVKYVVLDKKSVKPTEVQYLRDTKEEQLTLITCTEDNQKRLIIICKKDNIS